jgi:hypothetical protein
MHIVDGCINYFFYFIEIEMGVRGIWRYINIFIIPNIGIDKKYLFLGLL